MIKYSLLALISITCLGSAHAVNPDEPERRLNTITVSALPPDKGAVHINPIIRRPQDFERPGFNEMELVFVPVAVLEDGLKPLLGEENRDYLRLVTQLPDRAEGVPFEDTARDYLTQTVILPRGYYVMSEVTFRQRTTPGSPDTQTVSHCLADESFLLRVRGRDIMFLGRPEFEYPTAERISEPSFTPARNLLENLDSINIWRWTTTDLEALKVRPTKFKRSEAFCSRDAISPNA